MCYFVSVGAKAPAYRLAKSFDERADFDVAASTFCASVARAFPADDEVCLVTWHGCSCDLVAPRKQINLAVDSRARKPFVAFRHAVLSVARQFGGVRLLVHRHREPCLLPAPAARVTLTVRDFLSREHWFVEDIIMDIAGARGDG